MKICPGCQNEIGDQATCQICSALKVPKPRAEGPKIRRCSKLSFTCLLAAQVFIPIFLIIFVIFSIFDLLDGNFGQLCFLPIFTLFSIVQFVLIGLAIDYAEGRKFPDQDRDS